MTSYCIQCAIWRHVDIAAASVTSLRRRAQTIAPTASYWVRPVLDDSGCRDCTSSSYKGCRGRSLQCTVALLYLTVSIYILCSLADRWTRRRLAGAATRGGRGRCPRAHSRARPPPVVMIAPCPRRTPGRRGRSPGRCCVACSRLGSCLTRPTPVATTSASAFSSPSAGR